MFDFDEELKKFKMSQDSDLAAMALSGDETMDIGTVVRLSVQSAEKRAKEYGQLELEDFR